MSKIVSFFIVMLMFAANSFAVSEIDIAGTNFEFRQFLLDKASYTNGITGKTLTDVDVEINCTGDSTYSALSETGASMTEIESGTGEYRFVFPVANLPVGCVQGEIASMYLAATLSNEARREFVLVKKTSGRPDVNVAGTLPELSQGIPPVTPTFSEAVMALYMCMFRSEILTTTTTWKCKNDAGTVIFSSTLSDNGTTFTRGKTGSGP